MSTGNTSVCRGNLQNSYSGSSTSQELQKVSASLLMYGLGYFKNKPSVVKPSSARRERIPPKEQLASLFLLGLIQQTFMITPNLFCSRSCFKAGTMEVPLGALFRRCCVSCPTTAFHLFMATQVSNILLHCSRKAFSGLYPGNC